MKNSTFISFLVFLLVPGSILLLFAPELYTIFFYIGFCFIVFLISLYEDLKGMKKRGT